MARNFFRVFYGNRRTERSVLIPIMIVIIEKKFFEKSLEKNFWLEKIFFRGYHIDEWANPHTPLYDEPLTRKGSKVDLDREPA